MYQFIRILYSIYSTLLALAGRARGLVLEILHTSFAEQDRKTLHVGYWLEGNYYCLVTPRKRGPDRIDRITSSEIDVTEDVRKYMGPYHNFHGIPTTPNLIGFTNLTFYDIEGGERSFNDDQIIDLSGKFEPVNEENTDKLD